MDESGVESWTMAEDILLCAKAASQSNTSTLVVEGISKQVPICLPQNPRVESEHATSDAKDILLSIVNVLIGIGNECVDYAEGQLLQLIEAVDGENERLEGSFLLGFQLVLFKASLPSKSKEKSTETRRQSKSTEAASNRQRA
jgi:hypothetical protein